MASDIAAEKSVAVSILGLLFCDLIFALGSFRDLGPWHPEISMMCPDIRLFHSRSSGCSNDDLSIWRLRAFNSFT